MKCTGCLQELPANSTFCPYCGKKVRPQTAAPKAPSAPYSGYTPPTPVKPYTPPAPPVPPTPSAFEFDTVHTPALVETPAAKPAGKPVGLIIPLVLFTALFVISGIFAVYQYNEKEQFRWECRHLESELVDYKEELSFYNEHIALVNEYDDYYHTRQCSHLDLSEFWAYNTAKAESMGYIACPYCHY